MRTDNFVVHELLAQFEDEIRYEYAKKSKDRLLRSMLEVKSMTMLKSYMDTLSVGDEDEKAFCKLLSLELEYIRKKEKEALIHRIESKTGRPASGTYTLEEIGKVFGMTRERARQIEHTASNKLKHPRVSRIFNNYFGRNTKGGFAV